MAKNQTPYIFSTTKLRIKQIFKDLNALFVAVTGRSLPEGKRNREIAINNLKRCLEYDLTSNIDPTVKSKRSVTITKIYDPPLEKIEMRGRHGKYIDNVRPLLLQKGSFCGKKYVLYNQLGLFSKYFDTIKNTDEVREAIKICGYMEYDIWKEHKDAYSGENEYRSVIKNQLWRITKSALDSMKKSGIIEWKQYYVILPGLKAFIETNDEIEELSGSYKELEAQNKKHLEAIRERATAENSILQFSLASSILIGGNLASDKEYYDKCKYLLQIHKGQEFNIRATQTQERALENYEQYVMQCTYKELEKSKILPKVQDLPNKGVFFSNRHLRIMYFKVEKEIHEEIFGDAKFWKEIEYRVIDDVKAAKFEYYNLSMSNKQAADKITEEVLKYMDNQIKTYEFEVLKKDVEDIKIAVGNIHSGIKKSLSYSTNAMALHEELKQLYGIGENRPRTINCSIVQRPRIVDRIVEVSA